MSNTLVRLAVAVAAGLCVMVLWNLFDVTQEAMIFSLGVVTLYLLFGEE